MDLSRHNMFVCPDCLCWLANGDLPNDESRSNLPDLIAKRWPDSADYWWDMVPAKHDPKDDSDDEGHFSWSSCDCCGFELGGMRYQALAFKRARRRP